MRSTGGASRRVRGSWAPTLALLAACAGGCGDDGSGDGTTAAGTATTSAGPSEGSTAPTPATTSTSDPTGISTSPLDTGTADETSGDPTTGGAGERCGDGMVDAGEACDDGNDVDADGCNTDYTLSGSVLWFHAQAGGAGLAEEAFGIAVDPQGRAYVAGELAGGGNLDFWVRQYEDDGLGWTLSLDGGSGNAGARALALRGDALYAAGYRVVPGQSNDVWLRRFGLDGSVGWQVGYDDGFAGSNVGQGVAVDPGGHVIVVASHYVGDRFFVQTDAWVREYNAAGAPVWTAGYGGAAGGTDNARAVATDAAGRVAVVGTETVPGQGTNMWLRVYDDNGGAQWTATYANPNALDDEAAAVAFDAAGNVVVAGFEHDPVIPWRLWLTKYDPSGAPLWTRTWDGDTGEGARAFGVAIDDTGDIVVTGQHRVAGLDQLLVRKHDPDGNPRWVTTINGFPETNQVGRAVAIGPQRRVWVAGGVDQGVDGRDAYVARLAP
jgi:cysteine-rich repeat protein